MIGETTYKITVSRADSDVIKNLVDILENCPMGLNNVEIEYEEDFSTEHLISDESIPTRIYSAKDMMETTIKNLNMFRELYLKTRDKTYWWQMIQLLPSSYNQTCNVMLNYEVLANIYRQRKNHKLDEWREVCKWIESLPYSELITVDSREAIKEEVWK